MTVEVCSRLLAYQNSFQPFMSMSFERAIEGDLTVSRFIAPFLANQQNSSPSSPTFSSPPTENLNHQQQQHFSLLSKIKGLRPRISLSSSEAALQAIQNGRLVSAVAESEVPGVLLVASGSTIEVCHSSPRTLLAVTKELKHILESIVKDCPQDAHPGEFLTRFLIDSCFFNHFELINELIGNFNSAKERSILGSKHQAGSVFKLLFGLTEIVPLPESTSGQNSSSNANTQQQQQQY